MQNAHSQSAPYPTLTGQPPLVIAHRGASGYLPEHTLEAYARAIEMGADFIEPDLVSTKDGVLIARHEPWLDDTTDVASHAEFANRRTTRVIDGQEIDDWFAGDFTLAEIKKLRARQAIAMRDQSFNGQFEIPTFDDIIALVKKESERTARTIGIYPETKHPTFHRESAIPLEDRLLETLAREGWTEKTSPVIVQSFEVSNLEYIRTKTNARLTQLIGGPDTHPFDLEAQGRDTVYLDLITPEGLAEISTYADGIGVPKDYVIATFPERDWNGAELIPNAHDAGLFVHVYTFRNEDRFRLAEVGDTPETEYAAFFEMGADGVFSDFTDTAIASRHR